MLVDAEQARGPRIARYQHRQSTIDDLTKAVVIFLALVIPFCIFPPRSSSRRSPT